VLPVGVSKITGKSKIGDPVPVPVPVSKIKKPSTPVPVPGFWYLVFIGKPGTGVPILFNNIYILLKLYMLF
jgi:hypothetical protein